MVQAVFHFHRYLYGQNFKIRTYHSALQWLLCFPHLEGQVALVVPETRGGILQENDEDFKGDVRSSTSENLIAHVVQTENGLIKEITKEELRNRQVQDPYIGPIMRWLARSAHRPEWGDLSMESEETKALWAQCNSLTLHEGKRDKW